MTTININLLPEELRAKPSGGGMGGGASLPPGAVGPLAVGAAVAALLFASPMLIKSFYLEGREAAATAAEEEITQEINKYNTTLNSLKAIADKKELLRQQLATLQSVAGVHTSWADMLNEMRAVTPGNLWFDSLKTDSAKNAISVSGAALDYSSVAFFYRNLQNSEFFENPVLSKTEMSAGKNGVPTVSFTLDVTVRKTKKS